MAFGSKKTTVNSNGLFNSSKAELSTIIQKTNRNFQASFSKNTLGTILRSIDSSSQLSDLTIGGAVSKFSFCSARTNTSGNKTESTESGETKESEPNESKERKVDVKEDEESSSSSSGSSSSSSSDSDNEYEDPKLKAKYKNLVELYKDQDGKIEFTKAKFLELREAYIEKKKEVENIKVRAEKEKAAAKDFAITKFAKDLLDVSDNFQRAFDSIKDIDYKSLSDEEKIKTFRDFSEGKKLLFILKV